MASIFRAVDERTGQTVAIKVPHPEMEADPVFYDRFLDSSIPWMVEPPPGELK